MLAECDNIMNEKYFLAICIPTYNMAAWLPDLLDSILQQASTLDEPVQIAISDNASTDNTHELVAAYQVRYPHIRYFCHTENLGADRNFLAAAELGEARYCWLMGADDALAAGALQQILMTLRAEEPAVLLMDRYCCNATMEKPVYESFVRLQASCGFDFSDPAQVEEYLKQGLGIGALFSYLSALVVRRQLWQQITVDEQFIGSAYIHVYMILTMLFYPQPGASAKLYYLHFPGVLTRLGNDSFMANGKCKRLMIDVEGYDKFFNITPQRHKLLFLKIVKRYNSHVRYLKYIIFLTKEQRCRIAHILANQRSNIFSFVFEVLNVAISIIRRN